MRKVIVCCLKKILYEINKIKYRRKNVVFGKGTIVNGVIKKRGAGRVQIGNECILTSSSFFNPTSGDNKIYFNAIDQGEILIGNKVGISNSAISSMQSVKIEDCVLVGSGCVITDTDHHSINYYVRINENEDLQDISAPIVIKEGAFIGTRCIILKGVTIGRHSVIGAGSVVTKNIPDNEVWAGNPARFIKKIEESNYEREKSI